MTLLSSLYTYATDKFVRKNGQLRTRVFAAIHISFVASSKEISLSRVDQKRQVRSCPSYSPDVDTNAVYDEADGINGNEGTDSFRCNCKSKMCNEICSYEAFFPRKSISGNSFSFYSCSIYIAFVAVNLALSSEWSDSEARTNRAARRRVGRGVSGLAIGSPGATISAL